MSTYITEALRALNSKALTEDFDKDYIVDGLKFALEVAQDMDEEDCHRWYFNEYGFDKKAPEDEIERIICYVLKQKLDINESLEDDIDADRDDKVETAKKDFEKAEDDADADRDEKKADELKEDLVDEDEVEMEEEAEEVVEEGCEAKELHEADKPAATSIEDAQKWVDFDMERYGKISKRTNDIVRKAGFQIVKDDHGDYEVIVGHYE